MSDDREIVCNRIVFVDSEFDAKKGQGEPPGSPVCICAIEIDQYGRGRNTASRHLIRKSRRGSATAIHI
jgi:hypothetical protein